MRRTDHTSAANPLTHARTLADGRRAMPVDQAVAWAFRDELPKCPPVANGPAALRSGYGSVLDYGQLGTVIDQDRVNRYGCIADLSREALPHDDAVVLGDAVLALDGLVLDVPADWDPAPELAAFAGLGTRAVSAALRAMIVSDANGASRLKLSPRDLVIRRAVLPPDPAETRLDAVALRHERHANGQDRWFVQATQWIETGAYDADGTPVTRPETIELNGTDRRGRRKPGAYRKPFLDPDPVPTIIARAEHEMWLAALDVLAGDLGGQAGGLVLLPPSVPARPWLDGDAPAEPRVLPDLGAHRRISEARAAALRARFPAWFRRSGRRRAAAQG